MDSVQQQIETALRAALDPTALDVLDESGDHVGHVGNPDGKGQTHFFVHVVSPTFTGLNRVQQHRKVYDSLALLFTETSLHALRLKTETP
jgi:BolA protein